MVYDTKQSREYAHNGLRRIKVENTVFEVPSHYRPTMLLGQGAFGSVCQAKNERTGKLVAIKKCRNVFQEINGMAPNPKDVLREIKILAFCKHPQIITLEEVLPVRSNFDEVYIVTDEMDTNLRHILKAQGSLSHKHTQYFMAQLISAIYYLHSAGILHRDIKPSNILLNKDCTLKLCDLGLARSKHQDVTATEYYVVTRWYRAPELLIRAGEYDEAIDMWACGAVLAEMLQGNALWPGRGSDHQFQLILEDLGTPSEEEVSYAALVYDRFPLKRRNFRRELDRKYGSQAGDLIASLLKWNPDERLSAEETSVHPFLSGYMPSFPLVSSNKQFEWQYEENLYNQDEVRQEMTNFINNRSRGVKANGILEERKPFGGKYTRTRTVLKRKHKNEMKNSFGNSAYKSNKRNR